jgi:hypothetical protein
MADVYWNLHRDCFSVRESGKPVRHAMRVTLRDARFVVQRGGYERTVREHVKRVHAMVRGRVVADEPTGAGIAVTYNPYRADHFQARATGERVDTAAVVWFSIVDGKPVVVAGDAA